MVVVVLMVLTICCWGKAVRANFNYSWKHRHEWLTANDKKRGEKRVWRTWMILSLVLIGGVVALFLVNSHYYNNCDKRVWVEKEWTVEVCALKDNATAKGSFYLGYGSVSGTMMYVYWVKTEKGFIQQPPINAEGVEVIPTSDHPRIVWSWMELDRLYSFSDTFWSTPPLSPKPYEGTKITIYIPDNSIYYGFKVDGE